MATFVQKRRGPKISKLKSILEQYENDKVQKMAPQLLKQNKREAKLVMDIDDVAERLHTATKEQEILMAKSRKKRELLPATNSRGLPTHVRFDRKPVEDVLKDEIKKLKAQFSDVLHPQADLSSYYQTKPPSFFLTLPNQHTPEVISFKKNYLDMKRNLELSLLEDNRRQEAIHDILEVIAPGKNRERQRIKFYKLQKRVEKILKKEAIEQEAAVE